MFLNELNYIEDFKVMLVLNNLSHKMWYKQTLEF